jgi:hypothetical protein
MKVVQELKESDVSRQDAFTHAAKHAQIRLEQRKEAFRAILVHVPTCILLLRVIDQLMHVVFQRPIAAARVGVEPTTRLRCEVGSFLHCLDSEIAGRLQDDSALATDPGDDCRSVFVIMVPTGLTLLAATTRSTPQVLFSSVLGLSLLARGVIEFISFDRAVHLPSNAIPCRPLIAAMHLC